VDGEFRNTCRVSTASDAVLSKVPRGVTRLRSSECKLRQKDTDVNVQHKPVIASEAGISISSLKDISNAVSATFGTAGLILIESDLAPEFFDLKTGLAGELFQKFMNYQLRLAIVVPNPEHYGDRFNELAREHQTHNNIRIIRTEEEADAWILSAVRD
jgi:Domain of unknown function (DUF4180)